MIQNVFIDEQNINGTNWSQIQIEIISDRLHNAVMCTLSQYDVIGITRHLHIKLMLFSNITQPLHKEAVCGCSFLYIIAQKSVIMSEAF